MKPKTYWELLRDPRWQKKRLEVFERDKFTCQRCFGDDAELHVHHSYYDRKLKPWEYDMAYLHTLCADCHRDIEETIGMIRLAMMKHQTVPSLMVEAVNAVFNFKSYEAWALLKALNSGKPIPTHEPALR